MLPAAVLSDEYTTFTPNFGLTLYSYATGFYGHTDFTMYSSEVMIFKLNTIGLLRLLFECGAFDIYIVRGAALCSLRTAVRVCSRCVWAFPNASYCGKTCHSSVRLCM